MSNSKTIWMISTMAEFAHHSIERLRSEAKAQQVIFEVLQPANLRTISQDGEIQFLVDGLRRDPPDILFVKTGASTIQARTLLSMKAVELSPKSHTRVVNPLLTYDMFGDKWSTFLHLANLGIPTPESIIVEQPDDLDLAAQSWGFPLVLKETRGARGVSVMRLEDQRQGMRILEMLLTCVAPDKTFILQRWIETSAGQDIRILVCGGKPVAAINRRAVNGDFRCNVSKGATAQTRTIDRAIERITERICDASGLRYGGIDLMVDEGAYVVGEVNLAAQFSGVENATGINAAKLCIEGLLAELDRN